jgi:hypothetical protein
MAEARTQIDCVAAFKEGVQEFCVANKAEILVWLKLQWDEDIRLMLAELVAIRAGQKESI